MTAATVTRPGTLRDPQLFKHAAFVGGAWITHGESGAWSVRNPSTGEILAETPMLSRRQVAGAIDMAQLAYPGWRRRSGKERSQVLRRWFDLVIENSDDLATLIVLETGKPFAEAKGEVAYAASFIEWFAEEGKRVRGDVIAAPQGGRRVLVLKEPVGVCVAITPWNFPAAMITRKVAPALAAGCVMVIKPAEKTPLTALALTELARRAGTPAGVLNVVTGDPIEIGPELTQNPLVRKLTFTGSTDVGRLLLEQTASTVKRVSMELGGSAPFLVFDDSDLDAAVDGLLASKFRNTGQACIGANRIYVQDGIYESFARRVIDRVRALKVGDGFQAGVEQGPLIDDKALMKVERHVADALALGATLGCGGKRHAPDRLFYEPTVLLGVTGDMLITREETFGPVAPLIPFKDEEEAICMANDTEYGLAAYLFASDAGRIWRVSAALEAGMVGVNTGLISNEVAPFGGIKQSGIGREGSIYGMDEYLEIKYLAWEGAGER